MKKIKLFLASSEELKADRQQFEIFIYRKNKDWINNGIFLELLIWEDFLDAMSKKRLQDEYNNAIRDCDIFVMLFFTKVGNFTEEEFETAFGQFKSTNRPLIFTYFKDASISIGELNRQDIMSLFAFQEKLTSLGHFFTSYKNIDDLLFQFNRQLDKLEDDGFFAEPRDEQASNSKVEIDIAVNLITYLEDRRVLSNLYANEYPHPVLNSVQEIRKKLTDELGNLPQSSSLAETIRAMRTSCHKFLDYVQIIDIDNLGGDGGTEDMIILYARGFFSALGMLRGEFGIQIDKLVKSYNLKVGEELSPILPNAKTKFVSITGTFLMFEHGRDPMRPGPTPIPTFLVVEPIKTPRLEWIKFWYIDDRNGLIKPIEKCRTFHEKEVKITGDILDDTERILLLSIELKKQGNDTGCETMPDDLKLALLRLKSFDDINWY